MFQNETSLAIFPTNEASMKEAATKLSALYRGEIKVIRSAEETGTRRVEVSALSSARWMGRREKFLFLPLGLPPCISSWLGRATPTNRTSAPEMKLMAQSDHPNKPPTSSQPRRSPRTS